jgi:hypothetical protein
VKQKQTQWSKCVMHFNVANQSNNDELFYTTILPMLEPEIP